MAVFEDLVSEYSLGAIIGGKFFPGKSVVIDYHDTYFGSERDDLNGRKRQMRFRDRLDENGRVVRTFQVVYSIWSEAWVREVDQFRYFVSKKEKIYYRWPGDALPPVSMGEVREPGVRQALLARIDGEGRREVRFRRRVAQSRESVLASFDSIPEKDLYIVEVKAYANRKHLMREAMRRAMRYGGTQTTLGKYHLCKP
jgi:hypothetical protein